MSAWDKFIQEIRIAKSDLGSDDAIWYRGHSKISYELVPTLFRYDNGVEKERAVFRDVERSALQLGRDERTDDWDLLIDMQHYGIPTRLLDWTDVLGVAVAFALFDSNQADDSVIYLLSPVRLNLKNGIGEVRRVPHSNGHFEYKSVYWHGDPVMPEYPIAVDCILRNDRIAAQHGTFTVHGTKMAAFDNGCEDFLRKIILTADAKIGAREFLEFANLNPYSIFPDQVGLAQHLKTIHFP